jgi:glycosyltransferase involved in cell wall biosynthesis
MIEKSEQEIMKNWPSNKQPVVTICCAAFNHGPYIGEAIDSFLRQETDFPFEIIIRDDCSTDETISVINAYAEKYPNLIKSIIETENQFTKGIKAMQAMVKKGSGDFLALCEGDDYWTDIKKLQVQIDLMRAHPECYLSFHPADELIDGKITGKIWGYHGDKNKVFTDVEMIRGIGNVFCPTASMILNRKVMDPFPGFYNKAPVGDNFMQFLGSLNGGGLYIAKKMSIYRRGNPGSWSTRMKEKDSESVKSLIDNREKHIFRYIKSLGEMAEYIDQKYRDEINRKIVGSLLSLSLIYLNNNMYKNYREMIERSYEVQKNISKLHITMYYLRHTPLLARTLIKLRDNLR